MDLWKRLAQTQPPPTQETVALVAALAVALIAWPRSWRVLRQVVTIAHEAAHALVAVLTGRELSGIRLHRDTSGLTVTRGRPRGPGMVATLLAGYLGPGLLGLLGALLLSSGRAVLLLWLLLALVAGMVLWIRNAFGLLALTGCVAVLIGVTRYLDAVQQSAFALLVVVFLLLAAPRAVFDLHRSRRPHGASDADQLARLTRVPAPFWVVVFALGTLASALVGARLLVGWS